MPKGHTMQLTLDCGFSYINHPCHMSDLKFLFSIKRVLNPWGIERINHESLPGDPIVAIIVGMEGLPDEPRSLEPPSGGDR
jgi:hypothetical protein